MTPCSKPGAPPGPWLPPAGGHRPRWKAGAPSSLGDEEGAPGPKARVRSLRASTLVLVLCWALCDPSRLGLSAQCEREKVDSPASAAFQL